MTAAAVRGPWIGVSGFSYPDWTGPVLPRGRRVDPLEFVTRFVDLVEINTSTYRIPDPALARDWLRRTAHRARVRFTAKLHREFTHDAAPPGRDGFTRQRAFLEALADDGRLLATLAQFPPWFRASRENLAYVVDLATEFSGAPLAFEPRDRSWDTEEVRAALGAAGIAWVVGDHTPGPRSIAPRPIRTASPAYLRFHGRNASWHRAGVSRDERYDHLYAPADLAPWAAALRELVEGDERVVVAFNNHPRGQALANALQLRAAWTGERVSAPESLLAAYPVLGSIARSDGLFA